MLIALHVNYIIVESIEKVKEQKMYHASVNLHDDCFRMIILEKDIVGPCTGVVEKSTFPVVVFI